MFSCPLPPPVRGTRDRRGKDKGRTLRGSQSQGNRDKKKKERKRKEKKRKGGREDGKKRKMPSSQYIIEPIIKVYCLVPWDHRERLCEARGSNSKKLHFLELVHFSTFTERPVCTRQLSGKANMQRMTPPPTPARAHSPRASVSTLGWEAT